MQSKVHPRYKTKYHVANWAAYNQALVRRGDVTVWLSAEAIAAWTPRRSGRRGGQRRYSDLAIETALTLRLLYHLPLRQAEGFLHALFGMMRLDLSAPDYTTLSRRSQHLRRRLRPVPPGEGLHRQGARHRGVRPPPPRWALLPEDLRVGRFGPPFSSSQEPHCRDAVEGSSHV